LRGWFKFTLIQVNYRTMAKGIKSTKQGPQAPPKKSSKNSKVKPYATEAPPNYELKEEAVSYGNDKVGRKMLIDNNTKYMPMHSGTVILSDATDKPESQMTPLEKVGIVRDGISKKDLESLKEKTALDYDKLALALAVTRATLINKKGSEKFNAPLSERILDLASLYSYGYEVFEDEARFNQWMFRPNRALGGQAPYDLMDSQFGREEVRDIIGRIDYGVYS
jgi:putative toxin-antitoxin system antitoxin component (TIGR02293 family)